MHLCFRPPWSAILSFAAARAFASSLVGLPLAGTSNVDGHALARSDVLADSTELPPLASRTVSSPWTRGAMASRCVMDSRVAWTWALAQGLRGAGCKKVSKKTERRN